MPSLVNIARGWYNYAVGSPYTQHLMEQRLQVCDRCPHKRQLTALGEVLVKAVNQEGNLFKCALCTCPLAAKLADPESDCPIKRWKKVSETSYF